MLNPVFVVIDTRTGLQTNKSKYFSTNVIKTLLQKKQARKDD